eukprot:5069-Eustigmatos_ZCMA.PRE.1
MQAKQGETVGAHINTAMIQLYPLQCQALTHKTDPLIAPEPTSAKPAETAPSLSSAAIPGMDLSEAEAEIRKRQERARQFQEQRRRQEGRASTATTVL